VEVPVQVVGGTSYSVKLVWKSNQSDPGTIWAGAGPLNGSFSPTRLTVELVPTGSGTTLTSAVSTQQYTLSGSDGSTWTDLDGSALRLSLTPSVTSTVDLSGNADLWTSSAGYNQDLGIWISGGSYGSGQLIAWKESGGAASFSPNAAYVHTVITLSAGITYTVKLQWKANQSDPGTIWVGAGPINAAFSPTRLTAKIVTLGSSTVSSTVSGQQYQLPASDGTSWQDMDSTNLKLTLNPNTASTAILSGNADLWTNSSGHNQDLAIWVTGGSYGNGQLVGWKESGGSAAYSPDAAYVQAIVNLTAGTAYTVKLVWKANASNPAIIWSGGGPMNGAFSPTRLTAEVLPGTVSIPPTATPSPTPLPTSTPTPTSTSTTCPGSQSGCITAMLNILNSDRAGAGVAPLTLNTTETNGTGTCVGSYGHSVHMASLGAIGHDQFPADICIPYSMAGENVGQASYGNELTDLQQLDQSMMSEPHDPTTCSTTGNHACNTINPGYHQVGIGIYYINNQTWLTEDFTN
jgi:uncharacterized protein YkwD